MSVVHNLDQDRHEFMAAHHSDETHLESTSFDCSPAEQRWATALIRFNIEPAHYAHQSWLPIWSRQASSQLLSLLSIELLATHQLTSVFDWQMSVPASRLFMMNKATLERIALITGIAAHRSRLRQIVFKPHLEFLRTALGDVADTLWMPFAESIPQSSTRLAIQFDSFDIAALTTELRNAGYFQMLRLLAPFRPENYAAAKRAAFCIPQNVAALEQCAVDDDQSLRASHAIINNIVPHWAPAWTWLF